MDFIGASDSFSAPHLHSYSIIAIVEANMASRFPKILWDSSCLIIDSGSDESLEGESTDYGAVASAIRSLQDQGVKVAHPDVNTSAFGFKPDIERNEILYGLKAMSGVGDVLAKTITKNAPYSSMSDFMQRIKPTTSEMVALIKASAFVNLLHESPEDTMTHYLNTIVSPVQKLTLAQINRCIEYGVITEDSDIYLNYRMINFKKYVISDNRLYKIVIDDNKKVPKCGYNDRYYFLDDASQPFFCKYFSEDSIVDIKGDKYIISEKAFTKEVKAKYLDPLTEWLNNPDVIRAYNHGLYEATYDQYVKEPACHWNFSVLNYYDGPHELSVIDKEKYGVVDFYSLPEEPKPYDYTFAWRKGGGQMPIPRFNITRICGTVTQSDNDKHIVELLTETGMVKVKFNKGQYLFYNRRVAGAPSWFKRGTLLLICGFRDGDTYRAKVYKDTLYKHTVNKIVEITSNNELITIDERCFEHGED